MDLYKKPFRTMVWIAIALSIPFISVVLWRMIKLVPVRTAAEDAGMGQLTESLLLTVQTFFQQGRHVTIIMQNSFPAYFKILNLH